MMSHISKILKIKKEKNINTLSHDEFHIPNV